MDVLENLFPGIWGELVLVIIGIGAFMTGLTGLVMGGRRLPPFEIPPRLRGFANLTFALLTMVGLTLITNARPDFVERLFNTLTQ
ncbi:MAG: hypothetical protein BAA04_01215 [Firmicutes bacterium ZCTH02-B6]|nr:MAG: hypothetical protein BAA04_01215 [Firmicutes bacterium ZCTH02-B6]